MERISPSAPLLRVKLCSAIGRMENQHAPASDDSITFSSRLTFSPSIAVMIWQIRLSLFAFLYFQTST